EIIAQAGKFGAVTIATNMAGRGTDIILGGNAESLSKADLKKAGYEDDIITEAYGYSETEDETILEARALYYQKLEEHKAVTKQEAEKVKEAGGLFIVGTERHESRRIDNQLRGRAGRQGDVGASRFYISLEDDIMRLFGGDRMQAMMNTLKIEEDMPIENKILSSSIENAQKKVELRNFGIRKNVLQYDDVLNRQREIIYGQRDSVLDGANLKENIEKMLEDSIKANVLMYLSNDDIHDDWNLVGLRDHYINFLTTENDLQYTKQQAGDIDRKEIEDLLIDRAKDMYSKREELYGSEFMRELERVILLRTVDQKWMDHIDNMTELKRGIGLRAYAQRDPVVEYRMEGFEMFDGMVEAIKEDTTKALLLVQIRSNEEPKREQVAKPSVASMDDGTVKRKPIVNKSKKIGDNEPCPCGSGKKYKKCCGMNE
ncbi:MAG: SEC-C metal-binding domain-containing protein, partial [Oscillospiraceae bacterium]